MVVAPPAPTRCVPADFLGDLRGEVMKWLPYNRADPSLASELAGLPIDDLVARFFNWLNRLIHSHPRQVLRSQQYIFRQMPPREQVYLERIREEIEAGADLRPRLSRGTIHGFVKGAPITAKKNFGHRRDLDLLLNEWNIHHLHLPNILDADGFTRRDPTLDLDLLLFAIFRDEKAYLLDVLPHGEWTNDRLVEVAVRNWPDARLFVPINGILGVSQAYTQNDRRQLRAAGITTPVHVDGKVFITLTGGLTLAGTATSSTTRAHRLLYALVDLEKKLGADPAHFQPQIKSDGHDHPQNPEFHIIFARTPAWWGFAVKEEVTGSIIRIEP